MYYLRPSFHSLVHPAVIVFKFTHCNCLHLRLRDHEPAELAFYSRATTDIEYAFPFTDWGELAAKACPSFDVQKWLKEIGINQ